MPAAVAAASSGGPRRIDVHSHLPVSSLRGNPSALADAGGAPSTAWDAAARIGFMDRHGIQTQLLSLPAMFVSRNNPAVPPAADLSRAVNASYAEIISANPDRFGAFACLPGDDPAGALAELAYALDVLHLDGVALPSNSAGRYLGHPFFEPILTELNRRRVPLFVHPTMPHDAEHLALERPNWTIEYPIDTARSITNGIYTGVFDRYPHIPVIVAHCGGALPALAWRISSLVSIGRGESDADINEHAVSSALRSLYYDTALSGGAIASTLLITDPRHVLYGTDSGAAPEELVRINTEALDHLELKPSELKGIQRDNAAVLFSRFH